MKLGIIGGMGTRAGINFLARITDYAPAIKDQDFIEFFFHNNSKVPDRTRAILLNEESPEHELLKSIAILNHCEVQLIAMVCITSYHFVSVLQKATTATIINPVTLVAHQLRKQYPDARRVGLLATQGTVRSGLFERALYPLGFELVNLSEMDLSMLMRAIYMENGLKSARTSPQARKLLLNCIPALQKAGSEVIISGCTEIPLGLSQQDFDVPMIDCVDVMAKEVVSIGYATK